MEAVPQQPAELRERVHPLFPTHAEAKDPSNVFSDHLLQLFSMPIAGEENPLKILSLNAMLRGQPSGFRGEKDKLETENDAKQRLEKIVETLKKCDGMHSPDLILLQEGDAEILAPLFKAHFPEWELDDAGMGLMILFKPNGRLERKKESLLQMGKVNKILVGKYQAVHFEFKKTQTPFKLYNLHAGFLKTPQHHETVFKQLLTLDADDAVNTVKVIAGDTNTHVAPQEKRFHNITHAVIPMNFNEEFGAKPTEQMTEFGDAAFARVGNGLTTQLKAEILDDRTGEVFTSIFTETPQEAKWPFYRMLLCLTEDNLNDNKINGKTILEFEREFLACFPNSNILLRHAAKDNNERGYGFCFSIDAPIYKFIIAHFKEQLADKNSGFQHLDRDIKSGAKEALFFVSVNKMRVFLAFISPLMAAIQSIDAEIAKTQTHITNVKNSRRIWKSRGLKPDENKIGALNTQKQILQTQQTQGLKSIEQSEADHAIDDRIKSLKWSWINPFVRSAKQKIACLTALKAKIHGEIANKSLAEIVTEWENQTLDGHTKTNLEIIKENRNRLFGGFFHKQYHRKDAPEATMPDTDKVITSLKQMWVKK